MIETIAIGDELLTGKISDTNSTFVAQTLFQKGFRLDRQMVIADDEKEMRDAIATVSRRAKVAICFGGLGPTSDDKTVDVVSDFLKCRPITHEPSREKLEKRYRERQRPITPQALRQTRYPEKTIPLFNSVGMAPGFTCEIENCLFFFFPGVPAEMKPLFQLQACPLIEEKLKETEKTFSKTWKTLGLWESELQKLMDPIEASLSKGFWLGYRTVYPENHLSLYFRGIEKSPSWDSFVQKLATLLSPYAYTEDSNQELEGAVIEFLKERNSRICFVESATGGLAAQRLTRIPGASAVVWGAVTPYQKDAKAELLGVIRPNEGSCISEETTLELAQQAKKKSRVEIVASVTGAVSQLENSNLCSGVFYLGVLKSENGIEEYISKTLELHHKTRAELQWGATSYLYALILGRCVA